MPVNSQGRHEGLRSAEKDHKGTTLEANVSHTSGSINAPHLLYTVEHIQATSEARCTTLCLGLIKSRT